MADPYYNPEKFGVEIVANVDEPDMSYEFNQFTVWEDKDGNYYFGSDSGCSCPSPFENIKSLSELSTTRSWDVVERAFEEWRAGTDWGPKVRLERNARGSN